MFFCFVFLTFENKATSIVLELDGILETPEQLCEGGNITRDSSDIVVSGEWVQLATEELNLCMLR